MTFYGAAVLKVLDQKTLVIKKRRYSYKGLRDEVVTDLSRQMGLFCSVLTQSLKQKRKLIDF